MNTELFQEMTNDRDKALEKIKNMESALLLAELDDTIQFDIIGASNRDWTIRMNVQTKVYRAIMSELRDRLKEKDQG